MEESKEIRLCLKNMLQWFHNFCVENNIRYYALGGTLLGAMRHQGFIPWDNDVDLGLPRPDYDKLIEIMKNQTDRYILETPFDDADDFFYPFAKLYDTFTTAIENNKYKTKRGIYLDIFPIDGIGNTEQKAKINHFMFDLKFNFFVSRVNSVKNDRSKLKNYIIVGANLIPNSIINDKKLLLNICKECCKFDYDTSSYCGNLVGAYHYKEIVPKEYFGTPKLMIFEDFEIYCPEKSDEYLTHIYDDWHKIPDESHRKGHHDFLMIKLNKSYFE